jgi:aquaporin related protein
MAKHVSSAHSFPSPTLTDTAILQNPQPLREHFPALDRSIPEWAYNALVAILSEFLGTTFFLFFALAGTQVAYTHLSPSTVILPGSPARPGGMAVSSASLLYAALSVGFSMMVNAWIFFRISSGLFNPAITFGMVVEGSLVWKKGGYIIVAQSAGGMAAAGLVSGLFPGQLRAETLLGSGTSIVRGLCEYCIEI